jgi:hypothetical protein
MEEAFELPGTKTEVKTFEADIFAGPTSSDRKLRITITIKR